MPSPNLRIASLVVVFLAVVASAWAEELKFIGVFYPPGNGTPLILNCTLTRPDATSNYTLAGDIKSDDGTYTVSGTGYYKTGKIRGYARRNVDLTTFEQPLDGTIGPDAQSINVTCLLLSPKTKVAMETQFKGIRQPDSGSDDRMAASPTSSPAGNVTVPGFVWRLKAGYPKPDKDFQTISQMNPVNKAWPGGMTYQHRAGVTSTFSFRPPPAEIEVGKSYEVSLTGVSVSPADQGDCAAMAMIWVDAPTKSIHDGKLVGSKRSNSSYYVVPPCQHPMQVNGSLAGPLNWTNEDRVSFEFRPANAETFTVTFAPGGRVGYLYVYEPFRAAPRSLGLTRQSNTAPVGSPTTPTPQPAAGPKPPAPTTPKPPPTTAPPSEPAHPSQLTAGTVTGDVSIRLPNKVDHEPLRPGMVLPPRTLIDVDPDSSATFQLPDGATLTLQGGTIITIEELTPSGGQARIMVRVAMGAIIYRHQADARGRFARSDFMVRINDGVYSTRGTAFSLKFDPNSGMVTLSLTDGQLEFDPGHGLQKMLLDAPTTMTMSVKH